MARSKISSRGQTVIPKPLRDLLNLHTGDEVEFIVREDGDVVIKPATVDVTELEGALHRPGQKPVTIRQMKKAVRARAGKIT